MFDKGRKCCDIFDVLFHGAILSIEVVNRLGGEARIDPKADLDKITLVQSCTNCAKMIVKKKEYNTRFDRATSEFKSQVVKNP